MTENLPQRDARVLWHPFTQHRIEDPPLPVASARDAVLTLTDGRELIDAISSWWAILHGHGIPELVQAMSEQAARLDHVLFAGATHAPAVELAEALVDVAPGRLARAFFSDNGSTAVEVALKMAVQRHAQSGHPERRVFVGLEGSYHGDTFGAMSMGDPDPFFEVFRPLLFEARRVPAERGAIPAALEELGERAAGVLVEPMVQGAAGMRMYDAGVLVEAREACDRSGLPLIADEVMTGFGRTGRLFACEHAGVEPDLMALAKGLTGGTMPLSVTLATEEFFESFLAEERSRAFFHGHTFTAHPVGCAVALASLRLLKLEDTPAKLEALGARIEGALRDGLDDPDALGLRRLGGVVALDLPLGESGYLASATLDLRRRAIERGVLLRPLGDVLYAMPPARTTGEQADQIAGVMLELVAAARSGGSVP